MAHFAEVDKNGTVIRVVVTENSLPNEGLDWLVENLGGTWIQTSYNSKIRKNFAGAGFTYDAKLDAFIPPKPFASWALNEELCQWEPPVVMLDDGKIYDWDEESLSWLEASEA